jgi:crotonobetainyl-CoA:carnitine CoA-transferase CaiB-like acyl-CoA transferase
LNNSPLRFSDTEERPYQCSPECGEHNEEIFAELGVAAAGLAGLREEGAV